MENLENNEGKGTKDFEMISPAGMCRSCYSKKMVLDFDTEIYSCTECGHKYKVGYRITTIDGEEAKVPCYLGNEIK